MRPFSNIMPNFAANLHLLVDSLESTLARKNKKKYSFSFCFSLAYSYLCTLVQKKQHYILNFRKLNWKLNWK